jgi:hypothetical protein
VAVRRPRGDAQGGGRLLHRQAGEEPQLDQVGARLVPLLQALQGLVDGERLVRG